MSTTTAMPLTRDTVAAVTVPCSDTVNTPTGVAIRPANGIALAEYDPARSLVRITNTADTDKTVTVKAGIFTFACLGDLAINVPAKTGDVLIVLEPSRFKQRDRTTLLDFERGHTGRVTLLQVTKDGG